MLGQLGVAMQPICVLGEDFDFVFRELDGERLAFPPFLVEGGLEEIGVLGKDVMVDEELLGFCSDYDGDDFGSEAGGFVC